MIVVALAASPSCVLGGTERPGRDGASGAGSPLRSTATPILVTLQRAYDDYSRGRLARFYDVFTAASTRAVSRSAFLDGVRSCPKRARPAIEAVSASSNADGTWTVRWRAGRFSGADRWVRERGEWRIVIDDARPLLRCPRAGA